MAVQTVEQVQRLAPYLEGLEKRLLQSAFGEFDGDEQTSKGLLDTALNLPQFQVAGLDPLQRQALAAAPQMFGSYAPTLSSALGQAGAGQAALTGGLGMLADPRRSIDRYTDQMALMRQRQGADAISGGIGGVGSVLGQAGSDVNVGRQSIMGGQGAFQPTQISDFMNPFQQQVIDQAMADVARAGEKQRLGLSAQAVGAGAFGGSRQGIAEGELGRNVLEQQGKIASQLRQSGFESAAKRAQEAFESQQKRALAGGQYLGQLGTDLGRLGIGGQQLLGTLGQQIAGLPSEFGTALGRTTDAARLMGGLGQAYGSLAGTTADVGRLGSELGRADLGMLTQLGDIGRNFQSQVLEAQRQNLLQQQQEPFTRLQLGSQLLKGTPSGSLGSTFKSATTPDTNPFLAGIGAYTALQGISPSGGGAAANV